MEEERIKNEKGKEGTYPQPGFSASETPNERRIWPGLGIRRWVSPVVGLKIPGLKLLGGSAQDFYCMDGGNSIESCQPSDTCSSGPWLHTVDWIKNGNRKIQKGSMAKWHYDGILPL